jgi:hypothetical protein
MISEILTCHDDSSHRQSLLDCGPYETKTCRQTQAQNQEQSAHDFVLSAKRRYDTLVQRSSQV